MSKPLIIDTEVIIDYLRNNKSAVNYLEKNTDQLLMSAITVAELYAGIRNENEKNVIDNFLQAFEVVSIEGEIAQLGGSLRKKFGKSHGTGLADALIAACALHTKATLVTLNTKHYPMTKCIKPYEKLNH